MVRQRVYIFRTFGTDPYYYLEEGGGNITWKLFLFRILFYDEFLRHL